MREERRESWSARAQLRKRTPCPKNLVKTKAAVSGQIVICSEQKTFKPFSREDETKTEKQVKAVHEVPIVDIGPDYEAEGRHCSSGDGAMDPCLVPLLMLNKFDTEFPHFIQAYCSLYMNMKVLTTTGGMPVSNSLLNKVLNLQVSNALEQSNTVMIGLDPFLR